MHTRTQQVLKVMNVLVWIVYIGLSIETGAVIVSYVVSCVNPAAAKNVYKSLDLYPIRHYSFIHYTITVAFMTIILCLKATVAYMVIKILSGVNLVQPFRLDIAKLLERISYILVAMAVIALMSNEHGEFMLNRTGFSPQKSPVEEFLFIAGLVFIISQVFKRGVELQTENELTV